MTTKTIVGVLGGSITLAFLDFLWIGILMQETYLEATGSVLRLVDGTLVPNMLATVLLYIVLSFALLFWVVPRARTHASPTRGALMYGGLFGATLYAFYDLTNVAILSVWPWHIAVADILWGTVLVAIGSCVVERLTRHA